MALKKGFSVLKSRKYNECKSKTNWKLISLAIAAQSGYFLTTVQNLKSLFVAKIKFDAFEENLSRVELSG